MLSQQLQLVLINTVYFQYSLSLSVFTDGVLFVFAGAPEYTPKISLVCDEHHHPAQTQGSTIFQKIPFYIFTPLCLSKRNIS